MHSEATKEIDPAKQGGSTFGTHSSAVPLTLQWDKLKKPIAEALGLTDLAEQNIMFLDNRSAEEINCEKLQMLTGHAWSYLKSQSSYFLSGKETELSKVAELFKDKFRIQHTSHPSRPSRIMIKSRDLDFAKLETALGPTIVKAVVAKPT